MSKKKNKNKNKEAINLFMADFGGMSCKVDLLGRVAVHKAHK